MYPKRLNWTTEIRRINDFQSLGYIFTCNPWVFFHWDKHNVIVNTGSPSKAGSITPYWNHYFENLRIGKNEMKWRHIFHVKNNCRTINHRTPLFNHWLNPFYDFHVSHYRPISMNDESVNEQTNLKIRDLVSEKVYVMYVRANHNSRNNYRIINHRTSLT